MAIFIEVMLPVLLVFMLGFGIKKWKSIEIRSVSTIALYVFMPFLVFETIYNAELNKTYLDLVLFSFILLVLLVVINKCYVKLNKYSSSKESGFILSTAFMNSGNYGTPIILFAFGDKAFTFAVSFMILQQIIMNFFGIYYAAKGKEGIKFALKSVIKMPPNYVVVIAVLLNILQIPVHTNLMSIIEFLSSATIPLVMIVLGMQLADIKFVRFQWSNISFGVLLRLVLSPVIAYLITVLFFDMDILMQKVLIILSAMPSAATTVLFAVQFNKEPELVSSITLISTICSVLSISILLNVFI
ncbi:hypothetical protein J416_13651 [Gracilibacillus halophilus YIM-C55.5]|uniref:Transporter n=1 Tax=Gracilibacillus halophilus YIM-C55.5 TaxID=1308866 RepID=N4W9G4_9BACI|nr:AEC family transporter [Gracilibacillus halophilus]ENH95894.1 hypothetical protein J416_13651 [Gracilibacillus halophilus YIM-C55.5]